MVVTATASHYISDTGIKVFTEIGVLNPSRIVQSQQLPSSTMWVGISKSIHWAFTAHSTPNIPFDPDSEHPDHTDPQYFISAQNRGNGESLSNLPTPLFLMGNAGPV